MKEIAIALCRKLFTYEDDWSIVSRGHSSSSLISDEPVLLLCKKYRNDDVKYIPVYKDLFTDDYSDLGVMFEERLAKFEEQGYKVVNKKDLRLHYHWDIEEEMTKYAFIAFLSKGNNDYFLAMSHNAYTLVKVEDDNDEYITAISNLHLHSEEVYPYEYRESFKGIIVCDGVYYLKKGDNPYYYLYYVNGDIFQGHILNIHPKCKVICSKATDSSSIIKMINFPKGLIEIEDHAFSGCTDLMCVIIPEGIKSIGADAFSECYDISSIGLPVSIKELGDGCFGSPSYIASFVYKGTIKEWLLINKAKYWVYVDYDFEIECKDGIIQCSNKPRYTRHDKNDDKVTPELVDAQVKEIIDLNKEEKLKALVPLVEALNERLFYKRGRQDKMRDFYLGLFRLFNDANGGKPSKEQYHLFLEMLNYKKEDLSIEDFEECILDEDYIFLKRDTFDIITCGLPRIKRLNTVFIGSALLCKNNLSIEELKVIDSLMGPYRE